MKIALLAAASAALLSIAGMAQAAVVTIDFEELGSGVHASPIVYPSATFSSSTGSFYINGANVTQDLCAYNGSCTGAVTVTFAGAVNGLSFNTTGDDGGGANIFALVHTTGGDFNYVGNSDGVFSSKDFQNLAGYSNVLSLVLTSSDGAGVTWDDFTFSTAGVPEPATWALMIGGFGLAGAALRRRRAVPA